MGNRAAKGPAFERQFCRELSLWWSNGQEDSLFWRTSTSGARATTRRKLGKDTIGHYGDICATDQRGVPFTDVFTVELKRGYNRATLHDLLDVPHNGADQTYEKWIIQAIRSHIMAGSLSWMLVTKRDRRDPLVVLDMRTAVRLLAEKRYDRIARFDLGDLDIGSFYGDGVSSVMESLSVIVLEWNRWLSQVSPKDVLQLSRG